MASAARRAFTSSWGARRVFAQCRPRISSSRFAGQRSWEHQRIPSSNIFQSRSYHGAYSGASGQSWDGLVYSIMSNIRGEYNFGPECFLSAASSDIDSDTEADAPRDMRDLVPMRLNRPWLLATAKDIGLRLEVLCVEQAHTSDYSDMLAMIAMLERLGGMEEDNPKMELSEYREIFITLRDGLKAGDELHMRIISVRERPAIQNVQFSAECVWGVAVVNAALRRLEGTKIGKGEEVGEGDGGGRGKTFEGDLMMLCGKINGLLLDSKDNFPEGDKWFDREDEQRILESAVRVLKEGGQEEGLVSFGDRGLL